MSSNRRIFTVPDDWSVSNDLIGRKGRNQFELFKLKIPTSPSFIIGSQNCKEYGEYRKLDKMLIKDCKTAMNEIEKAKNKTYGIPNNSKSSSYPPLLLSIRSTAQYPIVGQLTSILNVGINDEIAELLASSTDNPVWAFDCHRRFLQSYGTTILKVDPKRYEAVLSEVRSRHEGESTRNIDLTVAEMKMVIKAFQQIASVPTDPWEQISSIIEAHYEAFFDPETARGRDLHGYESQGVALIVQAMVFGNKNIQSGCGNLFTRNPITGECAMSGQYLECAQGDRRECSADTPRNMNHLSDNKPEVFDKLYVMANKLESYYKDLIKIEYTFENNKVRVLQTSNARRSVPAALKVLVDLVAEEVISRVRAVKRLDCYSMDEILFRTVDVPYDESQAFLASGCRVGIGAQKTVTNGVATGKIVFTSQDAKECQRRGEPCILCTNRNQYEGFQAATAVLSTYAPHDDTMTALRNMNKVAVVCVTNLSIDLDSRTLVNQDDKVQFREQDVITVDGTTGIVYRGDIQPVYTTDDPNFYTVLRWTDELKRMLVKAKATDTESIRTAHALNADGILLYNLESFMPKSKMISEIFLSQGPSRVNGSYLTAQYETAFAELPVYNDLVSVFRLLNGQRVTVMLDSQLEAECTNKLAVKTDTEVVTISEYMLKSLEAIVGATIEATMIGIEVTPCVLLPSAMHTEMCNTSKVIQHICSKLKSKVRCEVGVLVETVRGCRHAEEAVVSGPMYAECIAFDSDLITKDLFGENCDVRGNEHKTNVLVELCCERSYRKVKHRHPVSVGDLIGEAIQRCRYVNPGIMTIVCGDHCANRESVSFFNWLKVNSIVCAPNKVPVAKVAAAQSQTKILEDAKQSAEKDRVENMRDTPSNKVKKNVTFNI